MKRGAWSTFERVRLRDLWLRSSTPQVARVLGRSPVSIERQAEHLFMSPGRRGAWTAAEDGLLRFATGAKTAAEIGRLLGRTEDEILARTRVLRRRRRRGAWTRAELHLLRELYGSRSTPDLEIVFARPAAQIECVARGLRLAKDKRAHPGTVRMPRWDPESVRRLRALYPVLENLEIARRLRRSVTSVANKAWQLGLRKSGATLAAIGRRSIARRWGGR